MRRVVRAGGVVAACTWDSAGGMAMLRHFWAAAVARDPSAPVEWSTLGRPDQLRDLFVAAGLDDVVVAPLDVEVAYEGFDDCWLPFTGGAGPAGAYCTSLPPSSRDELRDGFRRELGDPAGPFELSARAWAVRGRVRNLTSPRTRR